MADRSELDGISPDTAGDLVRRLRRVEGQLRGVQAMLTSDRSCKDVVTQLTAARKALQQTGFLLLADRLHHCAAHPGADGLESIDGIEQMFTELR